MRHKETGTSAKLALWYMDVPIQIDTLKTFKGEVTKECWKYLIGKLCLAEKFKRENTERVGAIYGHVGKEFGYVYPSLKRLVNYANAIDRIHKILPDIASDILNGKSRLSLPDTIILSKMDFPDICNIIERLANEKTTAKTIFEEQAATCKKPERRGRPKRIVPEPARISVKDTPAYNPDAQINGVIYTIPSWVSMIERAYMTSDFNTVSLSAKKRLVEELVNLTTTAESVVAMLSEVK
jgi:hypothetical protein